MRPVATRGIAFLAILGVVLSIALHSALPVTVAIGVCGGIVGGEMRHRRLHPDARR